jgi:hypothetical protein
MQLSYWGVCPCCPARVLVVGITFVPEAVACAGLFTGGPPVAELVRGRVVLRLRFSSSSSAMAAARSEHAIACSARGAVDCVGGAALAQRQSTGAEARRRLRGGAGGSLVPALSHCVRVRSVEARPARQAGSLPARFLGVTRHAVWLIDFGKGLETQSLRPAHHMEFWEDRRISLTIDRLPE